MRFLEGVVLVGLICLLALSIHPNLGYADQSQGTALTPSAAATDTVVKAYQAGPFMLAHWRGRYHRGWYGRPYGRWYYGAPYYYRVYPSFRCWWNGYRWVCPYKYRRYGL
jgi:hypothetical protein